jgi:hypothetical protein
MKRIRDNYAAIVATIALVVALTSAGALAGTVLVGSKQIRNGSILSQDIHKGGVKSSDVQNGTIDGADIGNGDVTPEDVTMPDPEQIHEGDVSRLEDPTTDFQLVDVAGSYTKEDPTSLFEVTWTGSAQGENGGEASGCVFQLRVDGQPAAPGTGELFVKGVNGNVSASALFGALPAGPHQVEVWAHIMLGDTDASNNSCTVGPAEAGIGQTFVASEIVV